MVISELIKRLEKLTLFGTEEVIIRTDSGQVETIIDIGGAIRGNQAIVIIDTEEEK